MYVEQRFCEVRIEIFEVEKDKIARSKLILGMLHQGYNAHL